MSSSCITALIAASAANFLSITKSVGRSSNRISHSCELLSAVCVVCLRSVAVVTMTIFAEGLVVFGHFVVVSVCSNLIFQDESAVTRDFVVSLALGDRMVIA